VKGDTLPGLTGALVAVNVDGLVKPTVTWSDSSLLVEQAVGELLADVVERFRRLRGCQRLARIKNRLQAGSQCDFQLLAQQLVIRGSTGGAVARITYSPTDARAMRTSLTNALSLVILSAEVEQCACGNAWPHAVQHRKGRAE
jgi:hypothetical protein